MTESSVVTTKPTPMRTPQGISVLWESVTCPKNWRANAQPESRPASAGADGYLLFTSKVNEFGPCSVTVAASLLFAL